MLGCIDCLKKLHDARMVKLAKDPDLSDGLFLACRLHKLTPIVLLDGDSLPTRLVNAFLYDSVGTFADLLSKVVCAEVRAILRRKL